MDRRGAGALPFAALTNIKRTLYGTTSNGGGSECGGKGAARFFRLRRSGAESVIHHFAGGADGAVPMADLVDVNGTLYGTTETGGRSARECVSGSCGTVFAITTSGVERDLPLHRRHGWRNSTRRFDSRQRRTLWHDLLRWLLRVPCDGRRHGFSAYRRSSVCLGGGDHISSADVVTAKLFTAAKCIADGE